MSGEDKNLNDAPLADPAEDGSESKGFWDDLKKYWAELKKHRLLFCVLLVIIVVFFALPIYCGHPFADWKAWVTAVVSGFAGAAGMASVILACYSVKQAWESDKSVRDILKSIRKILGEAQKTQEDMRALQDNMRRLQSDARQLQEQLGVIALDLEHVTEVAEENRLGIRELDKWAKEMDFSKKSTGDDAGKSNFGAGNDPDGLSVTGEPVDPGPDFGAGNSPDVLGETGKPVGPDSAGDDSGVPET